MMSHTKRFSLFFLLWIVATTTVTRGQEEIPKNNNNSESSQTGECVNQSCDAAAEGNDEAWGLYMDPQLNEKPVPPKATSGAIDEKLLPVKHNKIWNAVIEQQGDIPFGRVLDAGTGINSLNFLATLAEHGMTSYTAVTGSKHMLDKVKKEAVELNITDMGDILYGNWFNEKVFSLDAQLVDETYDVILVDYLIGAMDAFSPYMQDAMLKKLASDYLRPGGRMYVIGLEPLPDYVSPEEKAKTNSVKGANMICQMKHLRDSCILLGGNRIYREFPLHWMERQFGKLKDMTVLNTEVFPATWNAGQFSTQLDNGRIYLYKFPSKVLASKMENELNIINSMFRDLVQTVPGGRINFGSDYLVSAEKKK